MIQFVTSICLVFFFFFKLCMIIDFNYKILYKFNVLVSSSVQSIIIFVFVNNIFLN